MDTRADGQTDTPPEARIEFMIGNPKATAAVASLDRTYPFAFAQKIQALGEFITEGPVVLRQRAPSLSSGD